MFKRREFTSGHRFNLTSRLFKARKEAGITKEVKIERNQEKKPFVKHQRPSATDKIIKEREEARAVKEAERQRKDQEIKEKQEKRTASISRRREQNKKLTTRNRRGQPNLNNQIEHLLSKLGK